MAAYLCCPYPSCDHRAERTSAAGADVEAMTDHLATILQPLTGPAPQAA